MSNHTKEPWRAAIDEGHVVVVNDELGNVCMLQLRRNFEDIEEEAGFNAKRIVACVNALAGINPEAVGEMFRIFKDIHHILRLDRGDYKGVGSQEMFTIDALYNHFDNMEAAIKLAEKED